MVLHCIAAAAVRFGAMHCVALCYVALRCVVLCCVALVLHWCCIGVAFVLHWCCIGVVMVLHHIGLHYLPRVCAYFDACESHMLRRLHMSFHKSVHMLPH